MSQAKAALCVGLQGRDDARVSSTTPSRDMGALPSMPYGETVAAKRLEMFCSGHTASCRPLTLRTTLGTVPA